MATFLVTANIPELWAGVPEVVTIDGILPSGKHFIQDPAVRVVENITSADILCHVTEEEFAEANRVHDELLEVLGRELNRIHGVDRPTRFWLILLGPWLRQFTHVVFCRWYTLREVLRRYPDLEMRVVDARWEELTPQTHDEASLLFFSEPWNSWIYAVLLRQLRGDGAVTTVAAPGAMAEFAAYRVDRNHGLPRPRPWPWWKRVAVRALARMNRGAKGVVYATVFSTRDLLRFFWHLRLVPQVWDSPVGLQPWPIGSRASLPALATGDAFAASLAPLVVPQLPAIYLEGLPDLTQASESIGLPAAPRYAFSHNAFLRHDAFKLWAAERATSAATRLVGAQHGGGYGVYLHDNWTGCHEEAALHRFLTWGWSHTSCHEAVGVQIDRAVRPDPTGGLLLVLGPVVRMSNNLTLLQCSHVERQNELIRELLAALPREIVDVTSLRPKASSAKKPARAQTSDFDQFRDQVNLSEGESTLSDDLAKCRLAVVLYNETTLPINL